MTTKKSLVGNFFQSKDTKRLHWLMKHSYYPTFLNSDNKGYGFGVLPKRKTIRRAIDDAMKEESKR